MDKLLEEKKARRAAYTADYRARNREKLSLIDAEYYAANKDKIKAAVKEYRTLNRGIISAQRSAYRAANKEKLTAAQKEFRTKHHDRLLAKEAIYRGANRDKVAAFVTAWKKDNAPRLNALNSRRKARKLQATPTWADEFVISEAYELAQLRSKATGIKHHVDHIVPLQNKAVCGLHCEFNLRVIPGKENLTKNNRHWPDMP